MTLPKLAKLAVETYLKDGTIFKLTELQTLPDWFCKKAGVFVTIEKQGKLRGCIGTYLPIKENIGQETIDNAIAAASQDPRFAPVTKEDLAELSYTVYVLGEPEPVKTLEDLNPKNYGIIVRAKGSFSRTGLLLPDLEGIDKAEQQVFLACQKAGIDPEKEEISVYRFKAEKHQ